VRGFKKAMSDGEEEQSSPPKQIRAEAPDAEFAEAKKTEAKTEAKTERSS
jgi:Sec-independent protein translocase protein TatA